MGKPSNLARRKGSASYYFRQRWPQRFKRPGTPPEVWISLDTADYKTAIARLSDKRAEAERRFRAEPVKAHSLIYSRTSKSSWPVDPALPLLTTELAAPLAQQFFSKAFADLNLEPHIDPWDVDDARRELEDRCARLSSPGDRDELFGQQVSVLNGAGLRGDYLDAPCVLLRNYLHRAVAQLTAIRLARLNGDYRDQIGDALFVSTGADADTPLLTGSVQPVATPLEPTLVSKWAKERAVSAKGVDKHPSVCRWFVERGGPTSVEAIKRSHVLAFKDRLIEEGVAAVSVNAKLSCLRTMLGFAVENGYLDSNPATGVRVQDKDKDQRKRKEFSLAALQAIFSSPVYSEGARPTQGRGEAAYWIPLIALFTGARLEEIAQLRPKDIRLETYADGDGDQQSAWVIEISASDETSIKNASSERLVPVHPELERIGLISFTQAAQALDRSRLFDGLRPDKYGRLGSKWGEWWSRYRREICGVTDRRMVFHSFRHTFKQHARHVGVVEGVQRQIMGHRPAPVPPGGRPWRRPSSGSGRS